MAAVASFIVCIMDNFLLVIVDFHFYDCMCRCKQWVTNCGRTDLCSKSSEELNKSYVLCANHFEQSQFLNVSRNSLIYNAVPTLLNVSIFGLFIAVVN